MAKHKIYRVSIYLLDADRKRVLLHLCQDGPFANHYMPLSAPLNDRETPVDTVRKLVLEKTHLECVLMGHNPSMPLVLDERSLKLFPPLHVQVTHIDEHSDYLDLVYLGHAKAAPEFKENGPLGWFNQLNLKKSPTHVKHIVHYILALIN